MSEESSMVPTLPQGLAAAFCDDYDADAARALSAQYRRASEAAGSAAFEICRFGAMLDAFVSRAGFRGDKAGDGLKGWLAAHCPEINYNTAKSYCAAARGVRRLAAVAADVPLLALMGESPVPDGEMEAVRERVLRTIAETPLRFLRAGAASAPGLPVGGAREGAGRKPKGAADAIARAAGPDPDITAAEAAGIAEKLYKFAVIDQKLSALRLEDLRDFAGTVGRVARAAELALEARERAERNL